MNLLKDEPYNLIALIVALASIFVSIALYRKSKKRIPKFQKRLDNEDDIGKFIEFIHLNEHKNRIFFMDISLDESQGKSFSEDFRIDFVLEKNENGFPLIGIQVVFNKDDQNEVLFDMRPTSFRIKGHFKITHFSGPQMGWFTYILRCVKRENI
ncbi:MAG: hypothetical protein CVU05_01985 [Bacteroidetes bacterium HGW-Bacteroidetes-21]|jgi:hypothetical protein|nr:MAG: hypothetical protein CVU05_01985 [Bacteroidetes bacterium HGW-Bacteroidetes-21]